MPPETLLHDKPSNTSQLADEAYADLVARFPNENLTRLRGFLDNIAGRTTPVFHKDQSTELGTFHFPDLPYAPFIDPGLFFETPELEASFETVRAEASRFLDGSARLQQFGEAWHAKSHNEVIAESEWPKWKRLPFYNGYERRDENCALCPNTAAIIDRLVPQYGDFDHASFLVHDGKMTLMPHIDIFNLYVSLWLPIFVPEDCGIEVGGQRGTMTEGKCLAFDNSYIHTTWNNSDSPRIILSVCRLTPHLTDVETAAFKHIKNTYGHRLDAAAKGA